MTPRERRPSLCGRWHTLWRRWSSQLALPPHTRGVRAGKRVPLLPLSYNLTSSSSSIPPLLRGKHAAVCVSLCVCVCKSGSSCRFRATVFLLFFFFFLFFFCFFFLGVLLCVLWLWRQNRDVWNQFHELPIKHAEWRVHTVHSIPTVAIQLKSVLTIKFQVKIKWIVIKSTVNYISIYWFINYYKIISRVNKLKLIN